MRVYISGPMTGYPDDNFPAFNAAEEELLKYDIEIDNPATKGNIEGWSWADYLRYDLRQVLEADALVLLDGWENSKGAALETHVAKALGTPCFVYTEFVLLMEEALKIDCEILSDLEDVGI